MVTESRQARTTSRTPPSIEGAALLPALYVHPVSFVQVLSAYLGKLAPGDNRGPLRLLFALTIGSTACDSVGGEAEVGYCVASWCVAHYYITVAGAPRLLAALIVRGSDDSQSRTRVAVLPCVVMDETDHDAFADALAENLAREDLSRGEVMDALLRLQNDYGWSARYIARRIGRSKSDVIELLGIAKDESVAPLVRDELITATTAGQIRRLPKQLRFQAVEGVRTGELKTVEDVRRLRREEQAPQSADSSEGVGMTLPPLCNPTV